MEVLTKQQRIAKLAEQSPNMIFTSLAYHIDLEWMKEAYTRTRKGGAPGIDSVTSEEYAKNLEENLTDLLNRAKSGKYKAPPVKRVYIPKDGAPGEKRPLGIPTFEDKILQRAVTMVLEPIYENDFYDCSYGFRPKRSAHMLLEQLWRTTSRMKDCWIIEVDLRKYFDSVNHKNLREIVRKRVSDGVITRLIGKWLKAGVMEEGTLWYPEEGTPQGGVISPILSNIYLHEVLDRWIYELIKPRINGICELYRFADDFIIVMSNQRDAERVLDTIGKRMNKYGLTIHPDKSKLINFSNPDKTGNPSECFDLLGFTHYWAKSRSGKMIPKRKTMKKRLKRGLTKIKEWLKKNMHKPIKELVKKLTQKMNGHYGYYGITFNIRSLNLFYERIQRLWFVTINRRGGKRINWAKFNKLRKRHILPKPRIVHSYVK